MADNAAIILSIVSLVGTLITVGVTSWLTYLSNEHKRKQELRKVYAKYRDALLLATYDLQSRLYNIVDYNIAHSYLKDMRQTENLLMYTAFAVGQYLSWVHVIRQRAQFLQCETEQVDKDLTEAISDVTFDFSTDAYSTMEPTPFMLWRGDQMAIGELMTVADGHDLGPMGYGLFHKRWCECRKETEFETINGDPSLLIDVTSDGTVQNLGQRRKQLRQVDDGSELIFKHAQGVSSFREWFRPVVEGVVAIAEAKKDAQPGSNGNVDQVLVQGVSSLDQRVRRLQHRLVDLINILDPKRLRSKSMFTKKAARAAMCECRDCKNGI